MKKKKKKRVARSGDAHLESQTLWRWKKENHKFEASLGKVSEILSPKQNTNKRAGGMA
jgi:hypothetical protein